MHSGVPQGSHIGPLLFLLFIDDLCSQLSCPFAMYADDLKFFTPINCTDDIELLQRELNKLLAWCTANGMSLNVAKCEVITFSRKDERSQLNSTYNVEGTDLKKVLVIRDLGVLFDTKLSFKAQIDSVIAKGSMMLGFVKRRAKEFQCPYVTKSLYCSLVRSVLEYCSCVWSPYTAADISRVESVQRQFLLFALRRLQWRHRFELPPYEDRLMLIDMETLENRRKLSACTFIFDIIRDNLSVQEFKEWIQVRRIHRFTRSSSTLQLLVPQVNTNYQANNPAVRSLRIFNKFSEFFDFVCSRELFKIRVRKGLSDLSRLRNL